jgi:hypothetical protein
MLKGLVLGAAIGYGAFALGMDGGWNWITYGVVGAVVGLLVGRPLWALILDKKATTVVGMIKAVFGFGIGVGLYAIVAKAWGGFQLSLLDWHQQFVWNIQPVFGAAVGAIYGGFVELDDSLDDNQKKIAAGPTAKQLAGRK